MHYVLCIMIQFSHCPTMGPAQTLCIMRFMHYEHMHYEIVYCTPNCWHTMRNERNTCQALGPNQWTLIGLSYDTKYLSLLTITGKCIIQYIHYALCSNFMKSTTQAPPRNSAYSNWLQLGARLYTYTPARISAHLIKV